MAAVSSHRGHRHRQRDLIVPLQLPEEISILAPGRRAGRCGTRHRLNSAGRLDRVEVRRNGNLLRQPLVNCRSRLGSGRKLNRLQSKVIRDRKTLPPVERVESTTTHDLVRQERRKLELLRSMLN